MQITKFVVFTALVLTGCATTAPQPATKTRIVRELTAEEARGVPRCKCVCKQMVIEEGGQKWLMTSISVGCGEGTIWPWPKPGESW